MIGQVIAAALRGEREDASSGQYSERRYVCRNGCGRTSRHPMEDGWCDRCNGLEPGVDVERVRAACRKARQDTAAFLRRLGYPDEAAKLDAVDAVAKEGAAMKPKNAESRYLRAAVFFLLLAAVVLTFMLFGCSKGVTEPSDPVGELFVQEVQLAARALGIQSPQVRFSDDRDAQAWMACDRETIFANVPRFRASTPEHVRALARHETCHVYLKHSCTDDEQKKVKQERAADDCAGGIQ